MRHLSPPTRPRTRFAPTVRSVLLLVSIWLATASASSAGDDAFKLIVHPNNAAKTLQREFVRDAFLKKATNWPDGESIRPIDLSSKLAVRSSFSQAILKKSLVQLRSYWSQRIFSGTGVPPPEADSPAAAVAYVLANPGAVAYLPPDTHTGRAKVIEIDR